MKNAALFVTTFFHLEFSLCCKLIFENFITSFDNYIFNFFLLSLSFHYTVTFPLILNEWLVLGPALLYSVLVNMSRYTGHRGKGEWLCSF